MPSYQYADYIACPNLQEGLNNQFMHNPIVVQDPIGALLFVNSDFNTTGTLQRSISPGGGKYRNVELVYQPRFTDESSDSAAINCNGGTEYGNTSTVYQIDPSVGKSRVFTITPAELAAMCQSDGSWVAQQVQAHMDALARNINSELSTFIAANLGNFYPGTTPVTEKTTSTKDNQGRFVENLTADVIYEWQSTEWPGVPFLIGDGLLNKYLRAMKAGCCALSGVDLGAFAQQNDMVFLRDKNIATALGNTNGFAAIGAGSIQMLKYHKFDSEIMKMQSDLLIQDVIIDPKTGIPYDYLAKYDCGTWKFQLSLAYKFVTMPADAFRTDDPLVGTNGILSFDITNPEVCACPAE